MDSVLPRANHRLIPKYAAYAAGWYERPQRTFNAVLRAVLAETQVEDWQES